MLCTASYWLLMINQGIKLLIPRVCKTYLLTFRCICQSIILYRFQRRYQQHWWWRWCDRWWFRRPWKKIIERYTIKVFLSYAFKYMPVILLFMCFQWCNYYCVLKQSIEKDAIITGYTFWFCMQSMWSYREPYIISIVLWISSQKENVWITTLSRS